MTVAGLLLALIMPGPPAQVARVTAYMVLGVALCALMLYGLGYALVPPGSAATPTGPYRRSSPPSP